MLNHSDGSPSSLAGEDPAVIQSTRRFAASPRRLHEAFTDPAQLRRWWGPKDFTLTFEVFEPRVGGEWRFVLHGPDGSDYPNLKRFTEVAPERIAFRHIQEGHDFTMTMSFVAAEDGGTSLTWHLRFDSVDEAARVRPFIVEGNEQNFDRLEAVLGD